MNQPASEALETVPGPAAVADENSEKSAIAAVDESMQADTTETESEAPVIEAARAEEGSGEPGVAPVQVQQAEAQAAEAEPAQPTEKTAAADIVSDEPSAAEPEDGARPVVVAPDTSTGLAESEDMEPGVVPDSEAVMDEPVALKSTRPETPVTPARSSQQRFSNQLQQSMDWINALDDSVGTIQILLLSYDNFDPDNYYEYVASLAARDVDTGQLRVFKTLTGDREVYSVVYGEFASRKTALGAIDSLPEVLRKTAPLARSVGGLWQEIRRLDSKN